MRGSKGKKKSRFDLPEMNNIPEGEIVRIEKWRLLEGSDADVTAPQIGFRLRGHVYGHPTYKDGEKLTTSEVLKVEGNIVVCKSRRYLLGDPSLEWVNALRARGLTYDASDPLRLMETK